MEFWERFRWDVRRLYWQARKALLRTRVGDRWEEREPGFQQRSYPDYGTYVEHQRTKFSALRSKSVVSHDRRLYRALSERLAELRGELQGRSVLCLAARQGSEVRAFVDQGAFAVGIDLNPGVRNRWVVVGDFHDLQFADDSVDWVYTNSLDHAFDLDRIFAEVRRVLAPGGRFMVEANAAGDDGGASAGAYEATVWTDVGPLVERLGRHGFELESRRAFDLPWSGEQLVFSRSEQDAPEGREGSADGGGSGPTPAAEGAG